MEPELVGVVLCGGESRRMGAPKPELRLGGRSLAERAASLLARVAHRVVLSTSTPTAPAGLDLPVVPDRWPGGGPLVGILSALEATGAPHVLVLACDLPAMDVGILRALAERRVGRGAVVPRVRGRLEPLCAVYGVGALPEIRAALASGVRAVHEAVATLHGEVVDLPDAAAPAFENVNTPEDLARVRARIGGAADAPAP